MMTEHIKTTVKDFNSENGNSSFTHKELLIYLVKKMDEMEKAGNYRYNTCNKNFLTKGTFWRVASLGFALMGAISGVLATHIGVI